MNIKKAKKIFIVVAIIFSIGLVSANLSEYDKHKEINATSVSGNPVINKVSPIYFSCGNESITNTYSINIDCSNVNSKSDISFIDDDGSTFLSYEFEEFNSSQGGIAWVKDSIVRDGNLDMYIAYGNGNTDYSMSGTGSNPWTGVNAEMVQHLNEANYPTDNAIDSSQNGNDGTVTGAISTTGEFNGAGSFDGVDDDITITGGTFSLSGDFSIVSWATLNTLNDETDIIGNYNTGITNELIFRVRGDNSNNLELFSGSPTDLGLSPSTGNSQLFGVSHDNSAGQSTGYIDDTSNTVSDSDGVSDFSDLQIGDRGDNYDKSWDGILDEVRIYSTTKSSSWFQADYDASNTSSTNLFSQSTVKAGNTNPNINNISLNPNPDNVGQNVDINLNITDVNGNLDYINVTAYRDGTQINNTEFTGLNGTDGTFNLTNFFETEKFGSYSVDVYAEDSEGLNNSGNKSKTVLDEDFKVKIDSIYYGVDIQRDEVKDKFLDTGNLTSQVNDTQINVEYELTVNNSNGYFTETYNADTLNISSNTAYADYGGYYNFGSGNITDSFWNQALEKGNFSVQGKITFESSDGGGRIYQSSRVTLNTVDQQGIFENALEYFYNTFIKSPIDSIINLINTVIDTIVRFLYGVLESILFVLTLVLNVISYIVGLIITITGNVLQYFVFFHVDYDYSYNNTTYDTLEDINGASFYDVITNDVKIVENRTQTDEFDSPFSTTGKTFVTYNQEFTLYSYELKVIDAFVGSNNQSNNSLSYNEYELIDSFNVNNHVEGISYIDGTNKFSIGIGRGGTGNGGNIDFYEVNNTGLYSNGSITQGSWITGLNERNGVLVSGDTGNDYIKSWNSINRTGICSSSVYNSPTGMEISNDGEYVAYRDDSGFKIAKTSDCTTVTSSISNLNGVGSYSWGNESGNIYTVNGTHLVEFERNSWTEINNWEFNGASILDISDNGRRMVIGKGNDGFTVHRLNDKQLLSNNSIDAINSVKISPVGDKVVYNTGDNFKAYNVESDNIEATLGTISGSESDIAISSNGDLVSFTKIRYYPSSESTVTTVYLNADEPEASKLISLTTILPKLYELKGLPFGFVTLINPLFTVTGIILALLPEPIVNAGRILFSTGLTIILGAVDVIVYTARFINFIFGTGITYLKWMVYGFIGVKGLRYFEMLMDDNHSNSKVLDKAFDDLFRAIEFISDLAERSYIVLDRAFNTMIEILKIIKQYIPFI